MFLSRLTNIWSLSPNIFCRTAHVVVGQSGVFGHIKHLSKSLFNMKHHHQRLEELLVQCQARVFFLQK